MTFYDFSGTAATEEDHYLLSEVGKYQGMKAGRSEISIQSALTVNSSGVNSIKTVTVNSAHSGCENLCLAAVVVKLNSENPQKLRREKQGTSAPRDDFLLTCASSGSSIAFNDFTVGRLRALSALSV